MFKSLDKFVHLSEGCTGSWKGDTHHRPAPSCSVRSLYRSRPTITCSWEHGIRQGR